MPLDIEFDRYSLKINGKREFIRSGAMHYFRLPSVDLWRDRLIKLKAAGYNTVDLYFNWGFHSDAEGSYDFSGVKDVDALIQLTEELGFYLIARPGPYINAETNGGGFPNWLLAKKDIPLRNRKDSAFVWSDEYMKYVTEWWKEIVPKINQASNLILMQIENEYSTAGVEPDYIKALYDLSRELGVTVPLFHNDVFAAGLYSDNVDIYAFDNYSVTQFETSWRTMPGVFSMLDYLEQNLRNFCAERPMMAAELQAGWFGLWKGHKYEEILESLGREHIQISTKTVIGQGVTIFNHYKAIGGTNWDHIGSAETYTSYDFNAPISETGVLKESYSEAKLLNFMLAHFNLSATESVAPPDAWKEQACFYKLRQSQDEDQSQWLYLRNLEETPVSFSFELPSIQIITGEMKPHEMLILPVDVPLMNGTKLDFASTEAILQTDKVLILRGDCHGNTVTFSVDGTVYECESPVSDSYEILTHEGLTVIVLGQHWLDDLWINDDGSIVAGPDSVVADQKSQAYTINVEEDSLSQERVLKISADGSIDVQNIATGATLPDLPELKSWVVNDIADEVCASNGFKPVSKTGADLDANAIYDGTVWYELPFTPEGSNTPKTLMLDAEHIWGVFLNGQFIGEGHQLNLVHGQKAEPVFIPIPATLIKPDEENRIVILLHSLGHPKGFHDDAQDVQGIKQVTLDGKDVTSFLNIKPVDFTLAEPCQENSPIVKMDTDFQLNLPETIDMPLGLDISMLNFEHVQIYLNGVLLGRYWRECQAQSVFYLPEGVLNTAGINELTLIAMNFDPLINLKTCQQALTQVMLKPYQINQVIDLK